MRTRVLLLIAVAIQAGCASRATVPNGPAHAAAAPGDAPAIAQIYLWRAKPGKAEEYSRYIREVAEPIDYEAQRRGAFISVATYVARDTTVPWTHLRIFLLRDSAQLAALGPALDSAGMRLEPDSVKRRVRGEYSATLRDRVGAVTADLLR